MADNDRTTSQHRVGFGFGFQSAFEPPPAANESEGERSEEGFPGPLLSLHYAYLLDPSLYLKLGTTFGRSSEGTLYRDTNEWTCDYDVMDTHVERVCGYEREMRQASRFVLDAEAYLGKQFSRTSQGQWSIGPRLDVGVYFPATNNPGAAFLGFSLATEVLLGKDRFQYGLELHGGGLYEFGKGLRPLVGGMLLWEISF